MGIYRIKSEISFNVLGWKEKANVNCLIVHESEELSEEDKAEIKIDLMKKMFFNAVDKMTDNIKHKMEEVEEFKNIGEEELQKRIKKGDKEVMAKVDEIGKLILGFLKMKVILTKIRDEIEGYEKKGMKDSIAHFVLNHNFDMLSFEANKESIEKLLEEKRRIEAE